MCRRLVDNISPQEISALPKSPIKTKNNDNTDTRPFVGNYDIIGTNVKSYDEDFNGRGLGLLKDCREAISINFNLQLATNSDTFVISPFVFSPNKKNLKVVLLSNEINKLSDGYIDDGEIIVPLDINGQQISPYFDYTPTKNTSQSTWNSSRQVWNNFGIDLTSILANVNEGHFNNDPNFVQVKGIAVICNVAINATNPEDEELEIPNKSKFVIARNIPVDWDKSKATKPIYFGPPNKNNLFKNKQ